MAFGMNRGFGGGMGRAGGNMDPGSGMTPLPPPDTGVGLPSLPPSRGGFKGPRMGTPIEGVAPQNTGGIAPPQGGVDPNVLLRQRGGTPQGAAAIRPGVDPRILALIQQRLRTGGASMTPLLNGNPTVGARPMEPVAAAPAFQRRDVDYSQMDPSSRWFPSARLS